MKKLLLLPFCLYSILCFSQTAQSNDPETKTKFTSFISRTGEIMAFEDSRHTSFSTLVSNLNVKRRVISQGDEQRAFLLFELPSKYTTRTSAVDQDDIQDLFNAIDLLISESVKDAANPNYMERFYVTEDHFKIGYYVNNQKIRWYVDLDTRLSESTFFINDIAEFQNKLKIIMQ
jgi:hypothetical protein